MSSDRVHCKYQVIASVHLVWFDLNGLWQWYQCPKQLVLIQSYWCSVVVLHRAVNQCVTGSIIRAERQWNTDHFMAINLKCSVIRLQRHLFVSHEYFHRMGASHRPDNGWNISKIQLSSSISLILQLILALSIECFALCARWNSWKFSKICNSELLYLVHMLGIDLLTGEMRFVSNRTQQNLQLSKIQWYIQQLNTACIVPMVCRYEIKLTFDKWHLLTWLGIWAKSICTDNYSNEMVSRCLE